MSMKLNAEVAFEYLALPNLFAESMIVTGCLQIDQKNALSVPILQVQLKCRILAVKRCLLPTTQMLLSQT